MSKPAPRPRRCRTSATRSGQSTAMYRSRHKSDTIDLLQRGLSFGDQGNRRLAQKAQSTTARGLLQGRYGLAVDDDLAQFIIEQQDFRDGRSAAVARAT